ncbi:MAG: VanZ family protein [Ignavibacteriales bacterium]|nr:VanZ family protein [Ignavibacteriales bacterium]
MSIHLRHFLRYQFPAIGWALLIFIGSSIPSRYIPSYKVFTYDKLIHISLFLIFGLLVYRAIEPRIKKDFFSWGRVFFSISVVILYGVLDEMHQGSVPGRTLEIWDAVADTVGGVLAALVIYIQHRMRRHAPDRA